MQFEGVYVAVTTAFMKKRIDEQTYANHIERLVNKGISGIIICGSTGECSSLTMEEHVYLFKYTKNIVNERVQIIANSGANSTTEAIYLTREAEKIGLDGALLVAPYYVKPTQNGLYLYFKEIHDKTKNIPLILYNVPGRTVVDIEIKTILKISELERYKGIKEASSSLEKISSLISQVKPDFSVLSGNDSIFLPLLSVGGHGTISVIGNIWPEKLIDLYEHFKNNDFQKADEANREMIPLYNALSYETNPIPIKYALHRMGLASNELRLPLTPLSKKFHDEFEKILKVASLI